MAIKQVTEGWSRGWYEVSLNTQQLDNLTTELAETDLIDYMIENYGPLPEDYIMNLDEEDQGGVWYSESVFHPYPEPMTRIFYFRHASDAVRFKLQWA